MSYYSNKGNIGNMSFSKQIKNELLDKEIDDDDLALAFLTGVLRSITKIEVEKKSANITAITDVGGLYEYCNNILKRLYGDYAELEITEKSYINKTLYYNIKFPHESAYLVLIDTGLIERQENDFVLTKNADQHVLKNRECLIVYLRSVFLCCGTSSIKISEKAFLKSTTGYHLEMTSHSKEFLEEIEIKLQSLNIFPKLVKRKNLFVLYLKDANSICDFLALIGADNAVLILQNEIIAREMRNSVNRQINCLGANAYKTSKANKLQLQAIEIINTRIGIDCLSEDLQEVALLRLANTEESLQELANLSALNLTKSGINHRMKKIIKIAKELKG